ncbi:hypothetical protein pb186bvf_004871 [Paramecium bursaria]
MDNPVSILKQPNRKIIRNRKDKFKSIIGELGKRHQVSFKDQFDQKLVDIHEVENWKMYNIEDNGQNTKTSCTCLLF